MVYFSDIDRNTPEFRQKLRSGIGIKLNIIDKSDLRTNKEFLNFIDHSGELINVSFYNAMRAAAFQYSTDQHVTPQAAMIILSKSYNDTSDINHKKIVTEIDNIINKSIDVQVISDFRDKMKNKLWNAPILTVGIASLLNSKDSLIKNLSTFRK